MPEFSSSPIALKPLSNLWRSTMGWEMSLFQEARLFSCMWDVWGIWKVNKLHCRNWRIWEGYTIKEIWKKKLRIWKNMLSTDGGIWVRSSIDLREHHNCQKILWMELITKITLILGFLNWIINLSVCTFLEKIFLRSNKNCKPYLKMSLLAMSNIKLKEEYSFWQIKAWRK